MDIKKVLIIEDEVLMVQALRRKLEGQRFKVSHSRDGISGLEMALNEHPDLILLDIVLPGMDGLTLLTKLREDPWGKTVPVMILTNLPDGIKPEEAKNKGITDYLIKTEWNINDVVEKVKERTKMNEKSSGS